MEVLTLYLEFFANDMEIEIIVRHVQNLHNLTMYPALQSVIQPTEVPQDMEVIKEMLRESAALTTHHTCGTVAMLPRRVEGVVDQDLLVYRTKNMRVLDASISRSLLMRAPWR